MFQIDLTSRIPIYEQLINSVERYILLGILKEGEMMPSVRALSGQLNTNPNTILKAYSILDNSGIIQSVPGMGYFVCRNSVEAIRAKKRGRLVELTALVQDLSSAGISKEDIYECVEKAVASVNKTEQ